MKILPVMSVALMLVAAGCQQTPVTKENVNPAATRASVAQLSFATQDDAVAALLAAVKTGDSTTMKELFGPASDELVSPDKVQADNALKAFDRKATEKLRSAEVKKDTVVLYIGNEDWPFPIPLVKGRDGKWFYDTEAGKAEILARRIGADELETIDVCRAYVAAQREYGSRDRDGDGVLQYAQRVTSHEGQHDGLYWKAGENEEQSPLGPLMAQAEREGYDAQAHTPRSGDPFHGYYFRVLKAQGAAAPGGAYSYVINGSMIAGFGMVASPAEYGNTGVMTFIVNHQGKVYEKDLGPKTAEIVAKMTEYNPDKSWHLVTGDVASK